LNPIEQFWSIVKTKLKRIKLLDEEELDERIAVTYNIGPPNDLFGSSHYSVLHFEDCL
ncbi:hypothetical protein BJ944DRAFT_151983, partial [Cunninghamella echinulata]